MQINDGSIRIAAITGGINVPSARFRVRQLIEPLSHYGINLSEFCPKVSMYPPKAKCLRPLWGASALAVRIMPVLATYRFDITFLQREMISTFKTFELFTKNPRVFDVDDAIFLHRDGRFAKRIAQGCDQIICGNQYLAEHFTNWNKNVCIIPTAVDTSRYIPLENDVYKTDMVLGWIGTSGNLKYLYEIEDALVDVIRARRDVVLRVVSNNVPQFRRLTEQNVEFILWSPENEVKSIQGMTIGLMPLTESQWAMGKCSFKMLQYMACGIPVVVSPVGMNGDVLSLADVGIGARTNKQWVDGILNLLNDDRKRHTMGKNSRQVVEKHFERDGVAGQLAHILKRLC